MIAGNTRELIELGVIRPTAKPIKVKPTHSFRGSKYKIFKEARSLVRAKHFKSIKDYKRYMYIHGIQGVPEAPDIVYRNHGWKNYNDWIGLNKKKAASKRAKSSKKKKSKKVIKKEKLVNLKKNSKFNGLLSKRIPKALKSIKLIGNLSNRSSYDYNNYQVNEIIKQLKKSLKLMKKKFKI